MPGAPKHQLRTSINEGAAVPGKKETLEAMERLRLRQHDAEQRMLAALLQHPGQLDDALRVTWYVQIPVAMDLDNTHVLGAIAMAVQTLGVGEPFGLGRVLREMEMYYPAGSNRTEFNKLLRWDSAGESPLHWALEVERLSFERKALGQLVWPESLYCWYDADGLLLYVGITNDLPARQSSHARKSSWAQFAAWSTIERFPDRQTVEWAERRAIQERTPIFNHQHNNTPEARQRLVAYLVEKGRLDLLAPAVSRG